jgi:hypothetical protein
MAGASFLSTVRQPPAPPPPLLLRHHILLLFLNFTSLFLSFR